MNLRLQLPQDNTLQYPFDLTLMACIVAERYHLDHLTEAVGMNRPQLLDKMPPSFSQPVLPIIDIITVALGKSTITKQQELEILNTYGKLYLS